MWCFLLVSSLLQVTNFEALYTSLTSLADLSYDLLVTKLGKQSALINANYIPFEVLDNLFAANLVLLIPICDILVGILFCAAATF